MRWRTIAIGLTVALAAGAWAGLAPAGSDDVVAALHRLETRMDAMQSQLQRLDDYVRGREAK